MGEITLSEHEAPPTQTSVSAPAQEKAPPKSWADLVRTKPAASNASSTYALQGTHGNSLASSKNGTLHEALASYRVTKPGEQSKTSFLEPRGLVNTGNMCYMNSVNTSITPSANLTNLQSGLASFGVLRAVL